MKLPYHLHIQYEKPGEGSINYLLSSDGEKSLELRMWFEATDTPKKGEALLVPFRPETKKFENKIMERIITANELVKVFDK